MRTCLFFAVFLFVPAFCSSQNTTIEISPRIGMVIEPYEAAYFRLLSGAAGEITATINSANANDIILHRTYNIGSETYTATATISQPEWRELQDYIGNYEQILAQKDVDWAGRYSRITKTVFWHGNDGLQASPLSALPELSETVEVTTMDDAVIEGALSAMDDSGIAINRLTTTQKDASAEPVYIAYSDIQYLTRMMSHNYIPAITGVAAGIAVTTAALMYFTVNKTPGKAEGTPGWETITVSTAVTAGGLSWLAMFAVGAASEPTYAFSINGDKSEYLHARKHLMGFAACGTHLPPEIYRRIHGLENR